jgi:predicted enzyme related to lactoylglutathione lyase
VAFKDLCIDVTSGGDRPERVAAFWEAALDQPVLDRDEDGDSHLGPPAGGPKERTVWINAVPEAPQGKSRVHLDLRLPDGDPAPLVAAGGRIVRPPTADDRWHVVEDPDGVALCVMGPHPEHPDAPFGPFELVVDSADPERIAAWWAERTDGTVGRRPDAPFAWVEDAAGLPFMFWVFNQVPEPKTVKNRVHWDVRLVDATIDDLCASGATLLRPKDDEVRWSVLADPEGNEFCVYD